LDNHPFIRYLLADKVMPPTRKSSSMGDLVRAFVSNLNVTIAQSAATKVRRALDLVFGAPAPRPRRPRRPAPSALAAAPSATPPPRRKRAKAAVKSETPPVKPSEPPPVTPRARRARKTKPKT